MENKYCFTDDIKKEGDMILHRIKALRDFGCVKKGDLGGWIEEESNLSHEGNCWISGEAKVYGKAIVKEDAQVRDYSSIYDGAIITGMAYVRHSSVVYGHKSKIYGSIYNSSKIYNSTIGATAYISDCDISDANIDDYTIYGVRIINHSIFNNK